MSRNDNIIDCMVMLVLPLASVMSGCIFDHDVPCPPDAGGSFTIVNDWAEAPGADPAGMEYLFFPGVSTLPAAMPARCGCRTAAIAL